MLQRSTVVTITDSSGGLYGRVISVSPGCCRFARIGYGSVRISVCAIRRLHPRLKVRVRRTKKILFRKTKRVGTMVRSKFRIHMRDGKVIRFLDNAIVLWLRIQVFRGKRFYGMSTRAVQASRILNRFGLVL